MLSRLPCLIRIAVVYACLACGYANAQSQVWQKIKEAQGKSDWTALRVIYEGEAKSDRFFAIRLAQLIYTRPEFRSEREAALVRLIDFVRTRQLNTFFDCCAEVGRQLMVGEGPTSVPDVPAAIEFLSTMCNAGDYPACNVLAEAYHFGRSGRPDVQTSVLAQDTEKAQYWFDRFLTFASSALERGDSYGAYELATRKGQWDTRDDLSILVSAFLSSHRGGWYPPEMTKDSSLLARAQLLAEQWEEARGNHKPNAAQLSAQLVSLLRLGDPSYTSYSRSSLDWMATSLLAEQGVPQNGPQFEAAHSFAMSELSSAANRYQKSLSALMRADGISAQPFFESRFQRVFSGYQLQYFVRRLTSDEGRAALKNIDTVETLIEDAAIRASRIALDYASFGPQYSGSEARLRRYAEINGLADPRSPAPDPLGTTASTVSAFLDIRDDQQSGLTSIGNRERLQLARMLFQSRYVGVLSRFNDAQLDVIRSVSGGKFSLSDILKREMGSRRGSFLEAASKNDAYKKADQAFTQDGLAIKSRIAEFLKRTNGSSP